MHIFSFVNLTKKIFSFQDLLAVGMMIPLVSSHVQALGGSHVYVGLMGSMYSGFQLGSGPLIVITLLYYHIFTFHSTHGHHRALNLRIIFIDPRAW